MRFLHPRVERGTDSIRRQLHCHNSEVLAHSLGKGRLGWQQADHACGSSYNKLLFECRVSTELRLRNADNLNFVLLVVYKPRRIHRGNSHKGITVLITLL